jgi:hypothetical protein
VVFGVFYDEARRPLVAPSTAPWSAPTAGPLCSCRPLWDDYQLDLQELIFSSVGSARSLLLVSLSRGRLSES